MNSPQSIAHYRIVCKIGEGGMGAVYRATDAKLNRDVAIKVLPESFANDPARMARFEREAQVLASLNHTNIAQIYGIEQGAIVMELVEGQDLPTPLPIQTALDYALQIAIGLEAAHEKGIVHRDLKPANIKVTPAGTVKLLDFGLAKTNDAAPAGNSAQSPTVSLSMTQAGLIMGTASYMSPEQAAGKPVDKRADIWSFGVVLWEMLSGHRLFQGETVSHTLADVLRAEIDPAALPAGTPAPIRELIGRCLDRDLKTRLRDIGEARIAIQRWIANPAPAAVSTPHARRPLPWILAGVSLAALAALAAIHFRESPPTMPAVRSNILLPKGAITDAPVNGYLPALSPDGLRMAFPVLENGVNAIAVRRMDSSEAQVLPGTQGARGIFWSPDSQSIGFRANSKLKRVDLAGGPPTTLLGDIGNGEGSWGRDAILYSAASGDIVRVPLNGGAPAMLPVSGAKGGNRISLWFLPDGRRFLYTASAGDLYLGSIDAKVASATPLVRGVSSATYAQGYLIYSREGNLMAQPFDPEQARVTGPSQPLTEHVAAAVGGRAAYSVSQTGLLVFQRGNLAGKRRLGWIDRSGKLLGTVGEAAAFGPFSLSPDGSRLAVAVFETQGHDIWIMELARGVLTRFTYDHASSVPFWSPDGRIIAFVSSRGGHNNIYRKPVDGAGPDELVYADDRDKQTAGWSRDGKYIEFWTGNLGDRADGRLWLAPAGGGDKPIPVFTQSYGDSQGQFSPDGRWLAYRSTESGQPHIYVIAYPGSGGKQRISTSPVGGIPVWKPDGSELFYVSATRDLTAVSIKSKGGALEIGPPVKIFGPVPSVAGRDFDVSPDGKRFLTFVGDERDLEEPMTLLQNWTALLKK